ncbi:MAG TPA: LytTR family DNA-binding domain-containing protein, partial [Burkholderiaceae bacterium]|nr:LytTR family DNA-binding domain-containing protein [Burkholderiaceae bacterium]
MTGALIAEDEPLLAQALQLELARAWPELQPVHLAQDGEEAVELALALRPDVLFLDIRMPGRDGLAVAEAIVEDWPRAAGPLPLVVFVTAFDQYAIQAFDRAAVDYLLKPVQARRLAECCARLRELLAGRATKATDALLLERLRALLPAGSGQGAPEAPVASPTHPLAVLQASVGSVLHMIPVDEVIYFEAADKYVRVVTAEREALIRLSLRELLPQL